MVQAVNFLVCDPVTDRTKRREHNYIARVRMITICRPTSSHTYVACMTLRRVIGCMYVSTIWLVSVIPIILGLLVACKSRQPVRMASGTVPYELTTCSSCHLYTNVCKSTYSLPGRYLIEASLALFHSSWGRLSHLLCASSSQLPCWWPPNRPYLEKYYILKRARWKREDERGRNGRGSGGLGVWGSGAVCTKQQ